ncbi:MAG: radical SAM protein [Candidatus Omnitrophota bacterium]|jgi:radical SAM protein with 4Fe4S-binding SPASM domain
MDKFKIDSHKLMYHVPRVSDWLEGKNIFPIYLEISAAGSCNHRCTYCALDFMEYQPRFLKTDILKDRLSEMGSLGVKSIMYAGEGEPFLHKDMVEIARKTHKSGINVAFTTNGTLMKKEISEQVLGCTEWIKISINGATPDTYAKIHRTDEKDFYRLLDNLKAAVGIRRKNKYRCTLGMQLLLLPENHHEAVALAKLARDIGLDYLVIKPYSQHPQSKTKQYNAIRYSDYEYLKDELSAINTKTFRVIFRIQAMKKWDDGRRDYERCLALPFWSYIDAGGNVWGCSMFLGDERFLYGNIYEQAYRQIWEGKARKKSLQWVEKKMCVQNCRVNCRMDEINRYLWELKHPLAHVNFI